MFDEGLLYWKQKGERGWDVDGEEDYEGDQKEQKPSVLRLELNFHSFIQ